MGKPESAVDKKSAQHHATKAKKAQEPIAGACVCQGCKDPSSRFSFCDEHYDHFKFGLIKKSGEPVPDYDKKYEHYRAYLAKQKAQKVA
jgi:hypothetical protein